MSLLYHAFPTLLFGPQVHFWTSNVLQIFSLSFQPSEIWWQWLLSHVPAPTTAQFNFPFAQWKVCTVISSMYNKKVEVDKANYCPSIVAKYAIGGTCWPLHKCDTVWLFLFKLIDNNTIGKSKQRLNIFQDHKDTISNNHCFSLLIVFRQLLWGASWLSGSQVL